MALDYPEAKVLTSGVTSVVGVPLSVLAVSTFLERDGYDVKIVSGAEKDYLGRISSLVGNDTICVGISSMTGHQITQGIAVAKAIRLQDRSIPIVWGGFHPSILPEQTAESSYVDFVVRGYGERTFSELVKAIECGSSFEQIRGLTFLKKRDVISTEDRPVEDINAFPPVPYHLIDVEQFLTNELGKKTISYISSRGCPNDCHFCADRVVYQRRWNALAANRVLDDLCTLKDRYGVDSVRFYDSNFFVDRQRVRAICEGMLERKLGLRWGRVNVSAELLGKNGTEEIWELMQRAGCFSLLVGAESGYEKALDRINKRSRREDVERLCCYATKYNIEVVYSLMLGIPPDNSADCGSPREEFRRELAETLDLINFVINNSRELGRVLVFRFTPYPGSSLYKECKRLGWNEPGSLEGWSDNTLWKAKLPWLTEDECRIVDSITKLVKTATPYRKMSDRNAMCLSD